MLKAGFNQLLRFSTYRVAGVAQIFLAATPAFCMEELKSLERQAYLSSMKNIEHEEYILQPGAYAQSRHPSRN